MYDVVYKYLTDLLETVNNFLIVDEDDQAYHVVVNQQGESSLNQILIQKGFAMTWNLPFDYKHWAETEFEAKSD